MRRQLNWTIKYISKTRESSSANNMIVAMIVTTIKIDCYLFTIRPSRTYSLYLHVIKSRSCT